MCVCLNLFEVSGVVVFTLHHVKEYGDGCSPQLFLRDERHLQDRTHHPGNETDLIHTLKLWKWISIDFIFIMQVSLCMSLTELVPHVSDSKTNQPPHVPVSEWKKAGVFTHILSYHYSCEGQISENSINRVCLWAGPAGLTGMILV